ncbi:DUF3866 family protein [Effusibacillus consociatus]|uniref:DUF3866 family protein n=1 Tax=Effusibacillus consociatus TaxID=1117041 RepID=A0ABV9Q1V4_9BACL
MIRIEQGEVLRIISKRSGIQELAVLVGGNEERAIQYTDLSIPVVPGDSVWLNTTAVRLELGTGGYHFVLPCEGHESPGTGHIMKLRYTPGQIRVHSCEEPSHPAYESIRDKDSVENMIVISAELHSMLPAIAATISFAAAGASLGYRKPRVAYVMTDGGALPIAFSRAVAELKEKGLICGTVTVGHAYGGDLEAVNLYSGLLAAKHVLEADIAIVTMGPGIVGTGTRFGHTGIEQGQVVNAVASLGGYSIACPRISFTDSRRRHQGISHHSLTALGRVALAKAVVPIPVLARDQMETIRKQLWEHDLVSKHTIKIRDGSIINQASACYDLKLSTMGRTLPEEQPFFKAAAAAGILAAEFINSGFETGGDTAFPDMLAT